MNNTVNKKNKNTEISKLLFRELSEVLNEVHNLDYSVRFWTMLLQNHVRSVLSRKSIIDNEESFKKPETFAINGRGYPGAKDKFLRHLKQFLKYVLSRNKKNEIFNLLRNHHSIRSGFPENSGVEKDNLGRKLPDYVHLFTGKGETAKRRRVYELSKNYDDVFLRNCIKEMPKVLVEYFKEVHDEIELFEPDKKQFHVHHVSFYMKIILSKYMQYGAKVIWYQHGSELGEFEMPTGHYVQLSYVDEYRSWGWKINEKEVPWKAYRLESFKNEYKNYQGNAREYDFLLCYPEINEINKNRYIGITNVILNQLDNRKKNILARPRRSHKFYSHASKLKFIRDESVAKSTGLTHMAKDMSKCKLVIQLNVPATNFLECIYVDHPTTGILNNERPTDLVKPFYEFFLEKGVLHRDCESMISHLNSIDIQTWWENIKKEPMYKSFKETFTRDVHN